MARTLSFKIGTNGGEFSAEIEKVDRGTLYGSGVVEAFDEDDNRCDLITLDGDGRTMIPVGGVANVVVSEDGDLLSANDLIAVTADDQVIEPVKSSFLDPIEISQKASIEDYLSHLVKSVYQLVPGENFESLVDLLGSGDIYKFPFSYRGGFAADTAFLLANEDKLPFMIICTPAEISYVSFNDAAGQEAESDEEDADTDFSFDLM